MGRKAREGLYVLLLCLFLLWGVFAPVVVVVHNVEYSQLGGYADVGYQDSRTMMKSILLNMWNIKVFILQSAV